MKQIKITVEVDGNEVSRSYLVDESKDYIGDLEWGVRVADMLETLEKSHENKF